MENWAAKTDFSWILLSVNIPCQPCIADKAAVHPSTILNKMHHNVAASAQKFAHLISLQFFKKTFIKIFMPGPHDNTRDITVTDFVKIFACPKMNGKLHSFCENCGLFLQLR